MGAGRAGPAQGGNVLGLFPIGKDVQGLNAVAVGQAMLF